MQTCHNFALCEPVAPVHFVCHPGSLLLHQRILSREEDYPIGREGSSSSVTSLDTSPQSVVKQKVTAINYDSIAAQMVEELGFKKGKTVTKTKFKITKMKPTASSQPLILSSQIQNFSNIQSPCLFLVTADLKFVLSSALLNVVIQMETNRFFKIYLRA